MGLKQFTREEIHSSDKANPKFVIHDKVYDVTSFLNEHPGGEEVLLEHASTDASDDFDDVGHSLDAIALMEKYVIGEIVESQRKNTKLRKGWISNPGESGKGDKSSKGTGLPLFFIVAGIIVVLLALLYFQ